MMQQNIFLKILVLWVVVVNTVYSQNEDQPISPCEVESALGQLLNPEPGNEMHAAALRNQLLELLENNKQFQYLNDPNVVGKRTIGSIARSGLLNNGKRNIGAMARQGLLRKSNDEFNQKRSLATLAKNGQLPSREPDTDEVAPTIQMDQWMNEKRNMAAMARAGLIGGKRGQDSWLDDLAYYKRDPMSMSSTNPHRVRMGKRNLAALARGNLLPSYGDNYKRNVGALARDWTLPTSMSNRFNAKRDASSEEYNKRNIGALKNSPAHGSTTTKDKRSIAYDEYPTINAEMLEPVYQTPPLDYEELSRYMNEFYPYHSQFTDDFGGSDMHMQKRYLGSLVRDGWSSGGFRNRASKRNIGSLARMGLLRSDMGKFGQQRLYSRQPQDKRHIGALARSDITTNPSDYSGQPAPIVNAARTHTIPTIPLAGQPLDFSSATGALRNHDSTPSINEASADHFIQPAALSEYPFDEAARFLTNRHPNFRSFPTDRFNYPNIPDYLNPPDNDVQIDGDFKNYFNSDHLEYDDETNDNNNYSMTDDGMIDNNISINPVHTEQQTHCLQRLHRLFQNYF